MSNLFCFTFVSPYLLTGHSGRILYMCAVSVVGIQDFAFRDYLHSYSTLLGSFLIKLDMVTGGWTWELVNDVSTRKAASVYIRIKGIEYDPSLSLGRLPGKCYICIGIEDDP